MAAFSRTVWVRPGIRPGSVRDPAAGNPDEPAEQDTDEVYRLPVERSPDGDLRPWPEMAAEHQRVVVLADPGLGKSWLIRTETHRLCLEALTQLETGRGGVIIPVPLRCDELAAAVGQDLAEKAVAHLAAQRLLPERSRAAMTAKVRAGEVVLLLDALDELAPAENGTLRQVARAWAERAGNRARCVITSRIAGYTGSPVPGACEVELQAFTGEDTDGLVVAWHLPSAAASRLLEWAADPAVAAMWRNPLLLALLCWLAAQLPAGEDMPRARGQLFDRVLRLFLTREYRSLDNPAAPPLDDIGVDALMEVLAPLAFTFATQPGGWIDLMPGQRLLRAIRDTDLGFTERGRTPAQVLRELSVDAGVLVPAGDPSAGRSPGYLFFHRAVAEYLVARHLASLPESDWLAIVERHRWFDPDWAEVIPMLGECFADPASARRLIEHLLTDDTDPFHYSLFMAVRVWGARPDADYLLPAKRAAELAGQLVELIRQDSTRKAATAHLKAIAYLPQAVLTRLPGLDNSEWYVRRSAVEALAGRDGPGVTEALLGLLADPEWAVRKAVVEALAGREAPGVTEALLGLLADPDPDLQYAAVLALAGREGPGVTEALLSLLADPERGMRSAAVRVLGGREGPGVTGGLLALLASQDDTLRRNAVEALAGRDGPGVTEGLLGLLADPEWGMRSAALRALAGRGEPGVTEALLGLLADPERGMRRAAVRALAGRDGPGVTRALLGLLADPDPDMRGEAVRALAGRDGPGVTEALLSLLADWYVRRAAVWALAGREGPGVTEALVGLLADPDPDLRHDAVEGLAGRDRPGVTGALLSLLASQDPGIRRDAVDALAGRDGPGVTEALLSLLADRYVRRAAVWALAGREGPGVAEALVGLLADPDPDMRGEAVRALAGRKAPGVAEALVGLLADPDPDMRGEAVEALTGRKAPGVAEALLGLLADPDPDMRRKAVLAIAGQRDHRGTAREPMPPEVVMRHEAVWVGEGPGVTEALLGLLADRDLRGVAVLALAGRDGPGVTQGLMSLLADPALYVRREVVRALAWREEPGVTEALLGLLADPDSDLRRKAVLALAGREAPGVIEGLLGRLGDPDPGVRSRAMRALIEWETPQALLILVREIPNLSQSGLLLAVYIAERLMNRHYNRMDPSKQMEIRAAMASLTRTALTAKSAWQSPGSEETFPDRRWWW